MKLRPLLLSLALCMFCAAPVSFSQDKDSTKPTDTTASTSQTDSTAPDSDKDKTKTKPKPTKRPSLLSPKPSWQIRTKSSMTAARTT